MPNSLKTAGCAITLFFFTVALAHADNRGTDFWVVFPQNYTGASTCVPSLYIYSDFAVYGTVTAYALALPVNFSIPAGSYTTVNLSYVTAAYGNDVVTNTGIHIEASDQVTVYGMSKDSDTADGFLALPAQALGKKYIVLAYSGRFLDFIWMNSQLAVTASEDNTTVHIDCPINPGTRPGPYDITLNKGQAYQLADTASAAKDLTGTIITSDKPVAVFGGHRCAKVPEAYMAADYLVEQLPPVTSWGFECFSMPLLGRAGGDTFRVVAAEDGTSLTVNATPVAMLNQGQGIEFISGVPCHIKADKPVLAAQFANGMEYDGNSGDPFMMLLTHPEQFVTDSTIVVPGGYTSNNVHIVCEDAFIGTIIFDGTAIPAGSYISIGGGYSGTRKAASAGKHVITSVNKFGIWVYGFKDYESYGFQGGAGAIIFTPTVSPTITETHTITPTFSITETGTVTSTFTPSRTRTSTGTPTFSRTVTLTRTVSPTFSNTQTRTATRTPSSSRTPTFTGTPTVNPSASRTMTPSITPTDSATATITVSGTATRTGTSTETNTAVPTSTQTSTDTPVYSATLTPVVSATDTPTVTQTMTHTGTHTRTPSFTATLTFTATFTGSPTCTVTATNTLTRTITVTPAMTQTSTITATPTAVTGPLALVLKGSYPQPAQTRTEIIFWLSKSAEAGVKIFTVSGEVIYEFKAQPCEQGNNSFRWDLVNNRGRDAGSGVFLYKIMAKSGAETAEATGKVAVVR